jgi:hypothetical protein
VLRRIFGPKRDEVIKLITFENILRQIILHKAATCAIKS